MPVSRISCMARAIKPCVRNWQSKQRMQVEKGFNCNPEMNPLGIDPHNAKKVLIYRLGSLGDTVIALPALHLVARTFPNAQRLMLTNIPVHAKAPAASAIIGESGLVDGYMNYPVGTRSARTLTQLWWQIRRFRPQVLVYLANHEVIVW